MDQNVLSTTNLNDFFTLPQKIGWSFFVQPPIHFLDKEAIPTFAYLEELKSDKILLKSPLLVKLEKDEENFIISGDELEIFGYGQSLEEAEDDFGKATEDLYLETEENKDCLGPYMKKNWQALQSYFAKR